MKQEFLKIPNPFWIVIGGVILSFAVALAVVQNNHNALAAEVRSKGTALREDFETDSEILHEVHESVVRLEENQKLLMRAFNLVPIE